VGNIVYVIASFEFTAMLCTVHASRIVAFAKP
jgi:hypothetical protein